MHIADAQTDGGLTVFLVPRGEGVETKQIKTSYSTAAGTAYITFDNVKVPAENMLGPENGGLLVILSNFNVRLVPCSRFPLVEHRRHCPRPPYVHD